MDRIPFARAIFPLHAKMWDIQEAGLPSLLPDLLVIIFEYYVPIDGLRELAGLINSIVGHSQHPLTIATDTSDDHPWGFAFSRSVIRGWVGFQIYPSGSIAPVSRGEAPIERVWIFAHGGSIRPIENILTAWVRSEDEEDRVIAASRCMLLAYLYRMVSARRAASRAIRET